MFAAYYNRLLDLFEDVNYNINSLVNSNTLAHVPSALQGISALTYPLENLNQIGCFLPVVLYGCRLVR